MRAAASSDFPVVVEGVGTFLFGRRTMRDQIRINVVYAEFLEGVTPTPWLDNVCTWIATLQVMSVRVPEGFSLNLDEIDPLDDDCYNKLAGVYKALTAKEGSFRRPATSGVQTRGQGDGGNAGVLVPTEVRPDTNGPAVS